MILNKTSLKIVALLIIAFSMSSCGKVETREEAEEAIKIEEQQKAKDLLPPVTPRLLSTIKAESLQALGQELNLPTYNPNNPTQYKARKVAVLDNGFDGYETAVGKTLPSKITYMSTKKDPKKLIEDPTSHGLIMAEQFVGMIRQSLGPKSDPELHLIETNGYLSLKGAVDMAILADVEMILYSQVWEFSLNVNDLISKATNHGILWVNASGNFHKRMTVGQAEKNIGSDTFRMPHENGKYLEFEVKEQEQLVKITYSWNSSSYQEAIKKDINLNLYDSNMNKVINSELRRTLDFQNGVSSEVPMKITAPPLKPGKYYIELEDVSKNFVATDRFKITLDGLDVAISDGGYYMNAIQAPATHPDVICITATDYEYAADNNDPNFGRVPDIRIASKIILEDQTEITSTSTAAAAAAAKIYILSQTNNVTKITKANAVSFF